MRHRLMGSVAGLAAVAMVVAGCSSGDGGSETLAPATAATASGSGSSDPSSGSDGSRTEHGAPKVSDPLDASKYLTQPCSVLTTAQAQSFSQSNPGEPDVDSALARGVGPGCDWGGETLNEEFRVGFLSGNKKGLDDTYRGKAQYDAYFEETSVDGYPAVFSAATDARDRGECSVTTGISDSMAFHITWQGRLKGQASCDRAKEVASAVIQTIKGGAS